MSVDKWAYDPEKCDGRPCCGDCDYCSIKYEGINCIVCARESEDEE